ncbi:unnamed protein product, partial [Orchesella dallaii]
RLQKMEGLKEDATNFQQFKPSGSTRMATDEQAPGSGFGCHSNQYDYVDPAKSVWSFGLYCTIQEDLDLKSWPYFESCKKIWEKAEARPKVDRGIFTSFADVVRKREETGAGRDRGDSNCVLTSSSRSTNQTKFYMKHQENSLRRTVKANTSRSKRVPPCLFQYDDPISEELSLSLEPISSSSSHFSSDCDGENNDSAHNRNPSLVSKRDRDSAITERKKQPLLHPRMSTPASNSSVLSKRRYPPTCLFPYEDSFVEECSLEPVSSSSSHFSDVDLELSEIAYLQSRISSIAYANTPPSATQECTIRRGNTSQRNFSVQQNPTSPQPPLAQEKVVEVNTTPNNQPQQPHVIFPSAEFPTLASASTSTSIPAKNPDSGKIPKLMEIKLDMKDKLDASPTSPEIKVVENGLVRVPTQQSPGAKYDEIAKGNGTIAPIMSM